LCAANIAYFDTVELDVTNVVAQLARVNVEQLERDLGSADALAELEEELANVEEDSTELVGFGSWGILHVV
jgi:hypothetical protein